MPDQALAHIKVLEISENVAGAYAGKLLAGFGAEVLKLERPGQGDPLRSVGPFFQDRPGPERSIRFLWLNTSKKSATLDLEKPEAAAVLSRLARRADVLLTDLPPTRLPALGLTYDALRQHNAGLVMTCVSDFGQTGPYRDYAADEITAYALSGLMHLTGDPARAPLAARPAVTQNTAGMHAFIATLLALYRRGPSGTGEFIDVSVQESAIENIEWVLAEYLRAGKVAKRRNDEHALVPWQSYLCRDGYAAVIGGPVRHWLAAVDLFEEPRLKDAKYRTIADRITHRQEIVELLKPWLSRRGKEEIRQAGQARRLAFGCVNTLAEVLTSAHLRARGFFQEIDHPVTGNRDYSGPPFQCAETPWRPDRAPLLGEHNAALSAQPPIPPARTRDAQPSSPCLPLEGIRIVDLTHDWAGPHATRLLADFGAEVIKVEYIRRMDMLRGGSTVNGDYNKHPRWHQVNRNKLSITLDLKVPRDVAVFKDLIRISDAVIDNSRADVLKKLGLGYEILKGIRPDLIYVSMSAFGETGPESGFAGYGATLEPTSGVMSLTGYDEASKPMRIKEMDVTNGILGTCAIMTALAYRQRTGRGQAIDLAQQEAAIVGLIGEHLLTYALNGTLPRPLGNRHPYHAPQGCYRCQGDDKWVTLVVRSDGEWQRLCQVLGRPGLSADVRFATREDRARNHDELDRLLESWTCQRSHYEAMHLLQGAGLAAGAVLTTAELCDDPHLKARGYFGRSADGDEFYFSGFPFVMSECRGEVRRRGPDLGEHNRYVLETLLGRRPEEVMPIKEEDIGTGFDPE